MKNEENNVEERIPKQGDSFVTIGIVDLAVSLFTLSYPFYDPVRPYLQQIVGGNRTIRFLFTKQSKISELPPLGRLVKGWNSAEEYSEPLSPLSVCKRTMWTRRSMLKDAKEASFSELQGLATEGTVVVDNLRLACVAYSLGFRKPEKYLVANRSGASFIVGTEVPEWLKPHCASWDELVGMDANAVEFISSDGNDVHPVAVSLAAFINIAAWVKHLSSEKPYRRFNAGANKTLLVQEGSPRWAELIANGYAPE